jgi:uncharacterized protein (DUF1330 family)
MPAYVISDLEIRDAAAFERYRTLAAASIAQHGGRYLVRGGAIAVAEGGPPPLSMVIVEFPTMERLQLWYGSPEYAAALTFRNAALTRRLLFVEGVPPT